MLACNGRAAARDAARAGAGPSVDPEAQRKKEQEEIERKRAELRRHGTQVTRENFLVWRAKFAAEQASGAGAGGGREGGRAGVAARDAPGMSSICGTEQQQQQ